MCFFNRLREETATGEKAVHVIFLIIILSMETVRAIDFIWKYFKHYFWDVDLTKKSSSETGYSPGCGDWQR